MDVGHRLRVQLISTDVERGYIDFKRRAGSLGIFIPFGMLADKRL